jgi:hypothetical protein
MRSVWITRFGGPEVLEVGSLPDEEERGATLGRWREVLAAVGSPAGCLEADVRSA